MFRYVNRKGIAYFLHESRTKAGKVRYTLKRSADGAMSDLPAGYEALENVNGQASVRKARPRQIAPLEEKLAQAARKSHGLGRYRIEVKGRHITVFEPDRDVDEIAELLSPFGTLGELGRQLESAMRKQLGDAVIDGYVQHKKEESRRWLEETTHYSPVLRFHLQDAERRTFAVERMTWMDEGGWWHLSTLPLPEALETYLPHVGKESFFDLM